MRSTSIKDCHIIELDKHHHEKGNISVIENNTTIPFDVKRVYYLYDIPGGESRGGHAHKLLHQLMVSVSGSFKVILDDGEKKRIISLKRPYQALYLVPGIWRVLDDFSAGATCLVLASDKYDEEDYIRDYNLFLKYKHSE